MGIIAIAANPASGKDIRRLVSHATNFDNAEKTNIIERIILALDAFGRHDIYFMPERYNFMNRVRQKILDKDKDYTVNHIMQPYPDFTNTLEDTTLFAQQMAEKGADVLIVLGGDGTSRAAAKSCGALPLIPISTGTNNVYPDVLEGTLAGIAAAYIASGATLSDACYTISKAIHIAINGQEKDIALVDAVVTNEAFAASKALWRINSIKKAIVTQAHPSNIGFSSFIGSQIIILPRDPLGAVADIDTVNPNAKVALAAGVITTCRIDNLTPLSLGQPYSFIPDYNGMIALDGERELPFSAGDQLTFTITLDGPKKIEVYQTIELAQRNHFFKV